MITIVKKGTLPPEYRTYRETCYHCDTVFEFFAYEAILHTDQRDGDYLIIACPVCERNATKARSHFIGAEFKDGSSL